MAYIDRDKLKDDVEELKQFIEEDLEPENQHEKQMLLKTTSDNLEEDNPNSIEYVK
jgi:hypothetical protein